VPTYAAGRDHPLKERKQVLHLAARYPGAFFTTPRSFRRCCTDSPQAGKARRARLATLMRAWEAVSVEDVGLACELADRYGSRLAARDLLRGHNAPHGAARPLPRIKTLTSCRRGGIGRLDPADVGVWRREAELNQVRNVTRLPARVALPVTTRGL